MIQSSHQFTNEKTWNYEKLSCLQSFKYVVDKESEPRIKTFDLESSPVISTSEVLYVKGTGHWQLLLFVGLIKLI